MAWKVFPEYPANLDALKAINALLTGLAGALAFLLFTRRTDRTPRLVAFAAVVMLGYGSWQMMALGTALLSEPLFLVLATTTLLMSGRTDDRTPEVRLAAAIGLLAAATFLTRGIGLTLVAAVLLGEFLREWPLGWKFSKPRLVLAITALAPVFAWMAWTHSRAGDIPQVLLGPYGSYGDWYLSDAMVTPGRVAKIASAHWTPFLANLQYMWLPDAAASAAIVVLTAVAGLFVVGSLRVARRNPALAAFPPLYLLVVMAWPYEPDRFMYAILPLVTLIAAEGAVVAAERIRQDLSGWGPLLLFAGLGLLLLNAAAYQTRAQARLAWARVQIVPAVVYAPLNAWIRANVPEDAIIASGLDPYVFWQTGRTAVPAWQFRPSDYWRYDGSPTTLARDLDELIAATGISWVVVVRDEAKSGLTIQAFVDRYPDRIRVAFEQVTGPYTGVIYEVLPQGEVFAEPPATPPSPQ
ncbi:MAG: hypothetical protein E4H28_05390 [Gemmatimonadales bacterium]|nr:MAG: hypothetical protein E4H28_05390 [Gemmatimonadales bacterium]